MKVVPKLIILFVALLLKPTAAQAQEEAPRNAEAKKTADELLPELIERSYRVPASMIYNLRNSGRESSGADPFAADIPRKPGVPGTVKESFEEFGISFEGDSDINFDKEKSVLSVTNTVSQLELVEAVLDSIRASSEKQIHIYLEYIEVDHSDFSDWLFGNVMDSDGTKLRNEVQEWIRDGRAEIIESATVVARSGQRAKVESVDEYIYPTEYNAPNSPNEVTLKGGAEVPVAPVSPTAFETRNLGVTLEVDPVLDSGNKIVYLNLAPEVVKLKKVEHWHNKTDDTRFQTHFPTFHTMKISTQVVAVDGRYAFLGTTRPLEASSPERKDPIVLQFVRGDVGALGDWSVIEG